MRADTLGVWWSRRWRSWPCGGCSACSASARPHANEVEIVVLRHQLAVLQRQVPRPRYTTVDRMLPATPARMLPPQRWPVFLVTPSTLLR
jgi:hypothetical protein